MIAAFAGIYAVLFMCGYPLKVLLLNEDLKKYDVYITPWFGICLIIATFFPLSRAGISVASASGYFILAVSLINLFLFLKFRETIYAERGDIIAAAILAAITAAVYTAPLRGFGKDIYAFSFSVDFPSYMNDIKAVLSYSAEYMKQFREGIPHFQIINFSLNEDFRGCVFVHAFFAALSGGDIAGVTYAVNAFVLFLGFSAFRLFLGESRRDTVIVLAVLCALPFNAFYQRFITLAFMGQLFSFGITILAFFLEYRLSERGKFEIKTCLALVFILIANGLCYIEGLAYPLVPVMPYLLAVSFNKKYNKKTCFCNAAFSAGLFCLAGFPLIVSFVKIFFKLRAQQPGFPMHMPTFMDLAGVQGALSSADGVIVLLVASNVIFAAVLFSQIRKEGLSSFLSAACLTNILLHLVFCAMFFDLGEKASYNAYKSALTLSYVPVILMLRFLENTFAELRERENFRDRLQCLAAAVLYGVFAALGVAATTRSFNQQGSQYYNEGAITITEDNDIITMFAENPYYKDSDFIINAADPMVIWAASCYAPFGRTFTNDYGGSETDEKRVMKENIKSGDIYIAYRPNERFIATTDAPVVFENDIYRISRIGGDSLILSDYTGLARLPAPVVLDGREFRMRFLTYSGVLLSYMTAGERTADIRASFFNLGDESGDLRAEARVNGKFFAEFFPRDMFFEIPLESVPLKAGTNEVVIEFFGELSEIALMGLRYF